MKTIANRRPALKGFADVLEFFQDEGEDEARRKSQGGTWRSSLHTKLAVGEKVGVYRSKP